MTIGIDCRLAGSKHAGIGRYIEELVREVTTDSSISWVLFFSEVNQLPWLSAAPNIKIVLAPIRHYTVTEQVRMPFIFYKEKLDLLHVPHFNIPLLYTKPIVVTIHDLLWHEQKGAHVTTLSPFMYSIKYAAYRFIASLALSRARAVVVPSKTVQETLVRLEGTNPKKIVVTYEGVDSKWFLPIASRARKRKPILFYTGSLYPHKNVQLLLHALEQLPHYSLHISSSRTVFVDEFLKIVHERGLDTRVHYLGKLSDTQLMEAYQQVAAFVQPSLSEGFGLPALEAMACGTPVLASNIKIFQEIYKDAYVPFDPHSSDSLVKSIVHLEEMDCTDLLTKAQALAHTYTWKRMGQQTLTLYRTLSAM